jgi:hypothetical protein
MKIYRRFDTGHRASRFTLLSLFTLALAMLLAALPVAGKNAGQDKDKKESNRSVGFILSQDASAKDVGLPAYPGAQRSKDTSDDSSALQMGLWGGDSGFKLVVLKLDSKSWPGTAPFWTAANPSQNTRRLRDNRTAWTAKATSR